MKIVTLAQLSLMPVGTVISPLVMNEGYIEFDIQGTVKMKPKARITAITYMWLVITDELPDVSICDGRIYTNESVTHYSLQWNPYPHRFMVW